MFKADALTLNDAQIERFHVDGFLVVENVIDDAAIEALRARFPLLFAGDFDTGVFPDEWHWREGMSLPDVTRHMGNAWKSDFTIAKLVLACTLLSVSAFHFNLVRGYQGERMEIWHSSIEAKDLIEAEVSLPEGYIIEWGGQFENLQRAQHRLMLVVDPYVGSHIP